jgi:hypothetical protein
MIRNVLDDDVSNSNPCLFRTLNLKGGPCKLPKLKAGTKLPMLKKARGARWHEMSGERMEFELCFLCTLLPRP